MSSAFGTDKTVRTRYWLWREPIFRLIDSGFVLSTDLSGRGSATAKMLKGHLPRVIYHREYLSIRRKFSESYITENTSVYENHTVGTWEGSYGSDKGRSGILSPTRKVDIGPLGHEKSNSHDARPVHQISSMIKWIRTNRLSMKNSLSLLSLKSLPSPLYGQLPAIANHSIGGCVFL
jgi:hypothetical protein